MKGATQKLTWDDLHFLWKNYQIGISQIEQVPGFEDFEVVDFIEDDQVSELFPEELHLEFGEEELSELPKVDHTFIRHTNPVEEEEKVPQR